MITNAKITPELDLVWGAANIGKEIGQTERQTFHLLENGRIPAKKVGGKWASDRRSLRQFFSGEILNRARAE